LQTEWSNDGNGGNGGTAERMADGSIADYIGTAEWRKGYIPNLPDIFTVHTDTNTDTDDTNDTFSNCNMIPSLTIGS
jgi:hypothetical protein